MMKNRIIKIILGVLITSMPLFAYKEIVVDLSEQRAYAIEDGYIVFEGRISSGKMGRETPTGTFTILQKKRKHQSNLWPKPKGGAKMPYMMRLTNSGIAMHLGYVPNRPASHGCIRLKKGFARKLYRWARVGIEVSVEGSAQDYLEAQRFAREYYGDGYRIIDYHD
jgi:lipoprotein-anchoring transpeptidase ErfK/SrfK